MMHKCILSCIPFVLLALTVFTVMAAIDAVGRFGLWAVLMLPIVIFFILAVGVSGQMALEEWRQ